MRKLITGRLGLVILAFATLVVIALLLPIEVSAPEVIGLCVALLVIVGGFSWYYHFTSKDVGKAQSPPGPHPPGEVENGAQDEH